MSDSTEPTRSTIQPGAASGATDGGRVSESSAASITVAQTLELLEGPFIEVAEGVANGGYALWLGSGISRERLPDLRTLVLKVLTFLQERASTETPDGSHRKALQEALGLAQLREGERAKIDLTQPPASWPVIHEVVEGLSTRYSELLAIAVDGETPDYLIWNAVDVPATYGPSVAPDCEHLCVAILALEGAVSDVASANWDGLIEAALAELAGDLEGVARIVVLPDELRKPVRLLTLVKFHGCAVLAAKNPDRYRDAIVATRPQITTWNTSGQARLIREHMVLLATTKPMLMIGLSAQDENVQRVFAQAEATMRWSWPSNPPAHVVAADSLGSNHLNLLRVVYGADYDAHGHDIRRHALLRAYGKPLLVALVLFVVVEKLCAYLRQADAPLVSGAARDELADGLRRLRRRLAVLAEPDRLGFVKHLVAAQRRALTLFQEGAEGVGGPGSYRALGTLPVDRVNTDSALPTNGLRELAVALALLGRGEAAGYWSVGTGPVASGADGVLRVGSGGVQTAVFFVANGRAGVRLEAESVVDPTAPDVLVIHSAGPVSRATRSPRAKYGRTGQPRVREVDMGELLRGASDLGGLEEGFRQEAAL